MWLRKKTAGSASGGYEWEKGGDVIWVNDRVAQDLVARPGGEFEEADEPSGKTPPEEAGDTRAAHEIHEETAAAARAAAESPSGTKLNDGRWAQTDTKGDEPVHTGLRDTGAEFAPANVASAASTGVEDPHRTLTPGSSENKPIITRPVIEHDEDKGEDDKGEAPAQPKPGARTDRPLAAGSTTTSGTNQQAASKPADKNSTDKK